MQSKPAIGAFSFVCFLMQLPAQLQALAPTVDTVLVVDATQGEFAFSSISIPAGVTVRFEGSLPYLNPPPVRITVIGDVDIHGVLSVQPQFSYNAVVNGPGGVNLGEGTAGYMTFQPSPYGGGTWSGYAAGPAHHSSVYGSAIPFSLFGGSRGGTTYWNSTPSGPFHWPEGGGGGGGTLVLEAAGHIYVTGSITARESAPSGGGQGSGGSILLRAMQGMTIAPGASVNAGREGIIRLDSYDQTVQSPPLTVSPSPTVRRLPDLVETAPLRTGQTWQLRVIAPRGDVVFLAASLAPGSSTSPYGNVGIDLATAITFAAVALPTTGHDPITTFSLQLPNVPQLIGLQLWVQGLDWFTNQPPRYTQTLATIVQ